MLPFDVKPCRTPGACGVDENETNFSAIELNNTQPLLSEPIKEQPKPIKEKITNFFNNVIKSNPTALNAEKDVEKAIDNLDLKIQNHRIKESKKIHPIKHAFWTFLHYLMLFFKCSIFVTILAIVIIGGVIAYSKDIPNIIQELNCASNSLDCNKVDTLKTTNMYENSLPNLTNPILSEKTKLAVATNEWPKNSNSNLRENKTHNLPPNDGPIGFKGVKPVVPYNYSNVKELLKQLY